MAIPKTFFRFLGKVPHNSDCQGLPPVSKVLMKKTSRSIKYIKIERAK